MPNYDALLIWARLSAQARMRQLRQRVFSYNVYTWADDFLAHLPTGEVVANDSSPVRPALVTALESARHSGPLRLLLDYDGTLVPFAKTPELATPDEELLWLLSALAASPDLQVEVVSGRPKDWLEQVLGHLDIALWAEHGFWYRASRESAWQTAAQS